MSNYYANNASQQFNKQAVARSFGAAADQYDHAAVLQREVTGRLIQRLDLLRLAPQTIVDIGAGTGYAGQLLAARYPQAHIVALDLAESMLEQAKSRGSFQGYVCADVESLPFANHSVDFIFSNLALHWCNDLLAAFAELQRVLKPGGLLLFSTMSVDTLKELRASWAAVDEQVHVHQFIDLHEVGDLLVKARFSDPVIDKDVITMRYSQVKTLLQDLKTLGAGNLANERRRSLLGKQKFQGFMQAYQQFCDADQKFPATYEVIYGLAWGSGAAQSFVNEQGEVSVPLTAIRR